MKLKTQIIRYIQRLTIVLSISLTGLIGTAQAQTVLDTSRQWVSVEHIDLYSGQTLNDTISIAISAGQLTMAFREIERSFPISNISGNWTDIGQSGELIFDVQVLDLAGKGKLQRESGSLTLLIDLSERKDWMKRKFTLTNPL